MTFALELAKEFCGLCILLAALYVLLVSIAPECAEVGRLL